MPAGIKTLRICNNGHRYYKSSDCPVCPICESERKDPQGFLQVLSAPARRALENNGIHSLQQLADFSEHEILNMHGIGKKAISALSIVMSENKVSFKSIVE